MGRTRGYQPKASQPKSDQINEPPQSVTAICTPGDFSFTPEEREAIGESLRLSAMQPVPEGDDFVDEHPSKPYDPNDGMYEWAKPDAWIKEKDSEGRLTTRTFQF